MMEIAEIAAIAGIAEIGRSGIQRLEIWQVSWFIS